jgi:hypothetical protein
VILHTAFQPTMGTSMECRDLNSLLQLTHLKPNVIGNRLGPSGFLLSAPRRML